MAPELFKTIMHTEKTELQEEFDCLLPTQQDIFSPLLILIDMSKDIIFLSQIAKYSIVCQLGIIFFV